MDQPRISTAPIPKEGLKRGARGRFVCSSPLNIEKRKRAAQQKKHKEKRKEIRNKIYDAYLKSFLLRGSKDDSLPASRSKGRFCQIFERIVKQDYRLAKNLRYAGLKVFYSEGGHLKSSSDNVRKVGMQPNEYKGCRLPLVTLASEMAAVRKWVTMVWEHNTLLLLSVDDAFLVCKDILRNVTTLGSNSRSPLLPLVENASKQQNSSCSFRPFVPLATGSDENLSTPKGTKESTGVVAKNVAKEDSNLHSHIIVETCSELKVNSPTISELPDSAQEDLRRRKRLKVCLEISRNDQMYTLLYLALDDSLESRFGAFSGTYLRDISKQGDEPCTFVKEILTYAHWR